MSNEEDAAIRLEKQEKWILGREKHLQEITVNASENAIKFLFATNSGGAVSVLTYLGAIAQNNDNQIIFKTSLAIFFLGIILIGIFRTYVAEMYGDLFWGFNKLTKSYILEEINWSEYVNKSEDQALKHKNNIARIIVYASFVCFILGSIAGVIGLVT